MQLDRNGGGVMVKEDTLRMLMGSGGPISGENISARLGVSRAAVWKAVEALREEGYVIDSRPGLGYLLAAVPDRLTPAELENSRRVVGRQVVCLESTDSTNNECRRRAAQGAPNGLAVVAGEQTGGKGRRGRSFQSLAGKGLYLSVLLRPRGDIPLPEVTQITAWAAVAVCRALETVTGLDLGIKWTNDIILGGKKVCGILSELGLDDDGRADHVVVGIGINVSQTAEDFGPELTAIATSLGEHLDTPPRRAEVAGALLDELDRLWRVFPKGKEDYLEEYRERCVTLGRTVVFLEQDKPQTALALEVNEDFSLKVELDTGRKRNIASGEVSVRGLLGYI